MPASFIGLPTLTGSSVKILESSEYQREMNGLETISETFTVRSANRISLAPDRNTTHTAFSTSEIKHPRMVVENVSFREQAGGLTKMTVQYVGLTRTAGLPAPIIRLLPQPGKIFIEAEFVSDQSEESLVIIDKTTRMPAQINGVAMPPNPGPTVLQRGGGINAGGTLTALGFCFDSTSCVRRGKFLVVRASFRQKILGTQMFAPFSDI